MKTKKAIESINDLIMDTDNKNEKDIYNTFSKILKSLENLDLTEKQLLLIGKKIEELDLGSTQDKKSKYLKGKLAQFTKFLEDDFSLIEQGHYMSLGMALGMVVGLAIAGITGLEFGMGNETTGGLVAGMVIGMFIGSAMDSKAKKENRIFKIK